jgi:hypothetical protein
MHLHRAVWDFIGLSIGCLAAVATGCDVFQEPTATVQRVQSVEFREGMSLDVESRNGSVSVTYGSREDGVQIEADIRCGGETLEQAERRAESSTIVAEYNDAASVLRIQPAFPAELRNPDGASLRIRLPSCGYVGVVTSNDPIAVKGENDVRADSVTATTSNAPVAVELVDGTTTIQTSNGPVTARHIAGQLTVDTSNAPIIVANAAGELQLETSNGPIEIELSDSQSGPIVADTSNSPIRVEFGSGFTRCIGFDTSNSSTKINDPNNRITERKVEKSDGFIVVGDNPAATSRLDTSNSPIVIDID